MDGPALAAAIDGKRKELFDMRLENRQGRSAFKSNVVRNLSKHRARRRSSRRGEQRNVTTARRTPRHKTHHASITAGQGRQKTTFKSNVVRNLKKDIARMMPFLEAKQASGSPNVALREQRGPARRAGALGRAPATGRR